MIKNLDWLIEDIMINSNLEFETNDDFLIFLEEKRMFYNFDSLKDKNIPDYIIQEILETLNID